MRRESFRRVNTRPQLTPQMELTMAMRRELREQDDGGEVQSGGADEDEDALRDASVVPDLEVQ